jgi:hypothetical protein
VHSFGTVISNGIHRRLRHEFYETCIGSGGLSRALFCIFSDEDSFLMLSRHGDLTEMDVDSNISTVLLSNETLVGISLTLFTSTVYFVVGL